MKETAFYRSLVDTLPDLLRILLGWGGGVVLMGLYCFFVWFLYGQLGQYVMAVAVVVFLVLIYFIVDWSYRYQYEKKLHSVSDNPSDKLGKYFYGKK